MKLVPEVGFNSILSTSTTKVKFLGRSECFAVDNATGDILKCEQFLYHSQHNSFTITIQVSLCKASFPKCINKICIMQSMSVQIF